MGIEPKSGNFNEDTEDRERSGTFIVDSLAKIGTQGEEQSMQLIEFDDIQIENKNEL